jgi:hypothetical protein
MKTILFLLPALAACATAWTQAGGPYTPESQLFAVELPQGWMRARADKDLLATRDGLPLQWIYAKTTRFGETKSARKPITKGMLPEEAAEIVRDELASGGAAHGLTVLENSPATLAAKPGFRLVYRYQTAGGLRMKGVVYGVVGEDGFYGLGYVAPERHYFDLDLPTFDSVRTSFRILATPPRIAGQVN